jgi:hypothetical protein
MLTPSPAASATARWVRSAEVLVLDSGGFSKLSARTKAALALLGALRTAGLWPAVVPTMVLVESRRGDAGRDANANRFLKTCIVEPEVSSVVARRAAELRCRARAGSAVDALVVAIAEPGGTVLTGDRADLQALAAHAKDVTIEVI